ncbi:hypothetical protein OG302_22355 [Streptomyces sp. NBC_01283]|uniref:hypothetical protein n=1 Tax=Streptomyces sp. NBC_01283 TaxID=2903812 RepID=UPI00352E2179|nr:hypothetical protein OG302_22355 [Streptomyces sp. NBC_01283]
MRTRAAIAIAAALLAGLTACGKSDAEIEADCEKAIVEASTVTNRPEACDDLSEDDYRALLIARTLRDGGVVDDNGDVDLRELVDEDQ